MSIQTSLKRYAGAGAAPRSATTDATRALVAAGAAAGLLLPVVGMAQAFTRPGFDLRRHYMSQLSTGDMGWIQVANFIVTGLLYLAFAVGVWKVLHPGRADTAGPILLAGYGLVLVAAGAFVPDPANGFPLGGPGGIPAQMSWHSVFHGVAAIASFLFLVGACLVSAWRFGRLKRWGWMAYSIVSGLLCFAIPSAPSSWVGVTLFAGGLVGWVWVVALSLDLLNMNSQGDNDDAK